MGRKNRKGRERARDRGKDTGTLNLAKLEREAARQLERNRVLIEETKRGTPGAARSRSSR